MHTHDMYNYQVLHRDQVPPNDLGQPAPRAGSRKGRFPLRARLHVPCFYSFTLWHGVDEFDYVEKQLNYAAAIIMFIWNLF